MWEISPQSRFRMAELSAYWSASENADWEGAIAYDATASRGRARLSHIRRFQAVAAAASIEAGTDGSFAAGINLNFSLDSSQGGFKLTEQKMASTGIVEARVYRDINDNGIRDAGVCPRCRVLPVRIGDSFVVDANQFARGVVYAVKAGASVIAAAVPVKNTSSAT